MWYWCNAIKTNLNLNDINLTYVHIYQNDPVYFDLDLHIRKQTLQSRYAYSQSCSSSKLSEDWIYEGGTLTINLISLYKLWSFVWVIGQER